VFSPDGKYLASSAYDGTTRIWGTFQRPRTEIVSRQKGIQLGAISPDGKVGAIISGNALQLWETNTVQPYGEPLQHEDEVWAAAFSPDGKLLASGLKNGTARLWDIASRQPFGPLLKAGIPEGVITFAFSPDGKLLADGTWGWQAHVFEVATGRLLHTLNCQGVVRGVAFRPDGKVLATGTDGGMVQQWDVATGQQLGPPLQHGGRVWAIAFSPDGDVLATASGDKAQTIRLWDMSTGPSYLSLEPPAAVVRGRAALESFSTDGALLVRKLPEGKARVWRLPTAPTDLREMEIRTWVALGAQRNEQGEETTIPWQQWQKLREELQEYAPPAPEPEKGDGYYVPLASELKRDETEQTLNDWQEAFEVKRRVLGDEDPNMLNGIAWLLATFPMADLRNGTKAIEYATKACELTKWKNANIIDTLAAAYAEAGDFDSAIKWQKEAINLLTEKEPPGWQAGFEERLKLYQSGKPYRESP
jgi:WD40 repeat protein